MAFVKLDTGILNSTLWVDRESREVFLTALLMALPHEVTEPTPQIEVRSLKYTGFVVPPGWYGFVPAAGVGIIRQAIVEEEAGLNALERLGAPDSESRSHEFGGRRLVRVNGGYLLLNFIRYRDKDHTAAERMKRYRDRKRQPVTRNVDDVTRNAPVTLRNVTPADADADADAGTTTTPALLDHFTDPDQRAAYEALRGAASLGVAFDAALRAIVAPPSGGVAYPWPVVARALHDLYGANGGQRTTAANIRAFCRRIVNDDSRPVGQNGKPQSKLDRGMAGLTAFVERHHGE
jgi:hypothetical protein